MESEMTFRWRGLALLLLVAGAPCALALNCKDEHFKAAMTLAALPVDVRSLMLQGGPLADRGEAFQASDVGADAGLSHCADEPVSHPHRRVARTDPQQSGVTCGSGHGRHSP